MIVVNVVDVSNETEQRDKIFTSVTVTVLSRLA
jgi:hypothetical protein